MKSSLFFLLTALSLLPAHLSIAGPPKPIADPKAPKNVVLSPAPTQSRWSIGAGMVARQIEADFNLRSPGALNTSGLHPRGSASGKGDAGLFTGGNNATQYDDGSVGPDFFGEPPGIGFSGGTINTASQITDSGRIIMPAPGFSIPIYNVAFHTTRTNYSYRNNYTPGVYQSSDEEVGIGPYVELRYAAIQSDKLDVNVVFGYSWVGADLASGTGVSATQTITENRNQRRFTYGYDFVHPLGTVESSPFPFVVSQEGSASFIYDPDSNLPPGFISQLQDPRKGVAHNRSSRTIAEFYAAGSADLDIDLHELVLAPEISAQVGKRLQVGLSVGPTLNFVNTDFDSHAAWYRRGSSRPIKTYNFNQSGTEILLGVAAQATATYDLTDRVFLQGSVSYRYVQDFDVTAGSGSANVDLSSWQGTVGLGIRL